MRVINLCIRDLCMVHGGHRMDQELCMHLQAVRTAVVLTVAGSHIQQHDAVN